MTTPSATTPKDTMPPAITPSTSTPPETTQSETPSASTSLASSSTATKEQLAQAISKLAESFEWTPVALGENKFETLDDLKTYVTSLNGQSAYKGGKSDLTSIFDLLDKRRDEVLRIKTLELSNVTKQLEELRMKVVEVSEAPGVSSINACGSNWNPSNRVVRINPNIPKFKGSQEEDLDEWIFIIDAALGSETGVNGLNAITPLFMGRALSLLRKFRSENPFQGWTHFKLVLKENFDREDAQRLLRTSLRELRCFGRFSKFVQKFLSLTDKIVGMPDEELLYIFIDALQPATKRDILLRRPKTLAEAIKLATIFEECCQSIDVNTRDHLQKVNHIQAQNYARTEFPKKFVNRQGPKKPFYKSSLGVSQKKDISKVQCYKCSTYGHYARDCSKPEGKLPQAKRTFQSVNSLSHVTGLLSINGTVGGIPLKLAFDSGATASIISYKVAKKLNP